MWESQWLISAAKSPNSRIDRLPTSIAADAASVSRRNLVSRCFGVGTSSED